MNPEQRNEQNIARANTFSHVIPFSYPHAALRARLAIPTVLQSDGRDKELPDMASVHDVPLLWHHQLQLLFQPGVHVPLLPDAGGGLVPQS